MSEDVLNAPWGAQCCFLLCMGSNQEQRFQLASEWVKQ